MKNSKIKGRQGEDLAADYLKNKGWDIINRNWRKGPGEIDIIAKKDEVLAFVEVKTIDAWGMDSLPRILGAVKRRRIVETSKLFMVLFREFNCMKLRYDVILIRSGRVYEHLEQAFMENQ